MSFPPLERVAIIIGHLPAADWPRAIVWTPLSVGQQFQVGLNGARANVHVPHHVLWNWRKNLLGITIVLCVLVHSRDALHIYLVSEIPHI